MTTTSFHPGHPVSGVLNNLEFGDGYTPEQERALHAALICKFETLAHAATADNTISYCPYTSEIRYECWGETTDSHHCMDAITPHGDVEWGELAREASEYVADHVESIINDGVL